VLRIYLTKQNFKCFKDDYVRAWHELFVLVESSSTETSPIIRTKVDHKKIQLSKPMNVSTSNNACSSSQSVEVGYDNFFYDFSIDVLKMLMVITFDSLSY